MKIGIVWLPNVGKSTLFNALTKSYAADAANFPFCTIEPNVWVVEVKDERVDRLAEVSKSKNKVYATIKYVDIAWLVKGAHKWEGLGNQFLSNIREVDAIVQVVRYFKNKDVVHVEWEVNPLRDIEIINSELIFADLEQIESKLPLLEKKAKSWDKDAKVLYQVLKKLYDALNEGKLIYDISDQLTDEEKKLIKSYNFLTNKPFVYAINVWEEDLCNWKQIKEEFEKKLKKPVAIVCAKLEADMLDLSEEEKKEYLEEIKSTCDNKIEKIPTLDDLIKLSFDTVWLMYFFTSGEKETKAWTIKKWSTAPQAAWVIHSDFERGFIKAEVVNWKDFVEVGWWSKAREKGLVRMEGKDYIVQDGDVILFRFNV